MSILSKILYKKYGIIIKESESSYFNITLSKNNSIEKSLNEFYNNCETRYFRKSKIKLLSKQILKEAGARDKHTPQGKGTAPNGKGPAGNITDRQLIATKDELHIEDTVDTLSGKEAVYLEDENKNNVYKEMEADYINVFAKTLRTKKINN